MGGRTVFDEMSQGQSYTNPFDYLALELAGVYIMQNTVRGGWPLGDFFFYFRREGKCSKCTIYTPGNL